MRGGLRRAWLGTFLTPLVQWGPGWPCWAVEPCKLGVEGVLVVGDASDGQHAGGLWEVQPSHGRPLLSHICRVTHGEGAVAPGLGTGAHTSEDSMGPTLVATRGALGLTGLSVQEAAGGLGNAHHLCPNLGILWGVGQGAALGWEEGFTRDLFLPSPRLWACCCNRAGAESALGNYSLAEASPAPLGARLSWAPCQGINCP